MTDKQGELTFYAMDCPRCKLPKVWMQYKHIMHKPEAETWLCDRCYLSPEQ